MIRHNISRRVLSIALALALVFSLSLSVFAASDTADSTAVTVELKAAASMRYSLGERQSDGQYPVGTVLRMFEDANYNEDDEVYEILVDVTYDSSGNLLNQMRAQMGTDADGNPDSSGLTTDVFLSAAIAQMTSATSEGIIASSSNLLRNNLVLIANVKSGLAKGDVTFATAAAWLTTNGGTIALGDPSVVPAGSYAQTVFTNNGTWSAIQTYAKYYSNVTYVLGAVSDGSNTLGAVYATDAATEKETVKVLDSADVNIIYPVGITTGATSDATRNAAANELISFFTSDEAMAVFEAYGFSAA